MEDNLKQKLAVEVTARFPLMNGNKGRVSNLRKSDFIEGAKFMYEILKTTSH